MKTTASETLTEVDRQLSSTQDVAKLAVTDEAAANKLQMLSVGDKFINGLALILTQWVKATSASADNSPRVPGFYSQKPPSIGIQAYLKRIHHFFVCSDECFVLALVYINRIVKKAPEMTVSDLSVHRIVFFALMLAAKIHDDVSYGNGYYARVGGLPVKEVNTLEMDFLKMLNWKTFVAPNEYDLYHGFLSEAAKLGLPLQQAPRTEPEPEPEAT